VYHKKYIVKDDELTGVRVGDNDGDRVGARDGLRVGAKVGVTEGSIVCYIC
jgi:hypothetical protein